MIVHQMRAYLYSHFSFLISPICRFHISLVYEHSTRMYEHDLQMHVVDHLNACEAENGSQKGQRRKKKKREKCLKSTKRNMCSCHFNHVHHFIACFFFFFLVCFVRMCVVFVVVVVVIVQSQSRLLFHFDKTMWMWLNCCRLLFSIRHSFFDRFN